MAAASLEVVDLKFRCPDGTDIGPQKFDPTTTVTALKECVVTQWPSDKPGGPKTVNDVKLINAGKVLENNKTLGESRVPVGEIAGMITMHVVVRPPGAEQKAAPPASTEAKQGCSCAIL